MTRENAIPSQAELIRRELIKHGIKNGADFSDLLSEKAYNAVKAVLAERAERLKNPL